MITFNWKLIRITEKCIIHYDKARQIVEMLPSKYCIIRMKRIEAYDTSLLSYGVTSKADNAYSTLSIL